MSKKITLSYRADNGLFISLVILSLCFGKSTESLGQTQGSKEFSLPRIIQPSPNASSLGRYGDIPVSLATGVPNISIDLHRINSSHLSVPLSIVYHGSGVKVQDRASVIGLGWSPSGFWGAITRVKQGVWDEEKNGFHNIIFPSDNDPAKADKEKCLAIGMTLPFEKHRETWDGQPDIYFYNFNGRSGRFVFKNRIAKGVAPEITTIPYSPLKITFHDIGAPYTSGYRPWARIKIVDTDGTTYIFGASVDDDRDTRETTWTNSGDGSQSYDDTPHTTTWYLANIISADQSDIVTFKYTEPYITGTQDVPVTLYGQHRDIDHVSADYSYPHNATLSSFTNTLNLSEIQFKTGKVVFSYEDWTAPSVKRLSDIKIYNRKGNSEKEIKRFVFSHSSYRNSNPLNSLRLDAITEQGFEGNTVVSKPPYQFQYFTNGLVEVPPYKSKSQDLFGYYNGKSNDNLLLVKPVSLNNGPIVSQAANRKPSEEYLKIGTLRSIRYPTGGLTAFEFQANQTTRTYTETTEVYSFLSAHISNLLGTVTETFTPTAPLKPNEINPGNATIVFTASPAGCSTCAGTARFILKNVTTNTVILDQSISDPASQYIDPTTGLSTRRFYLTLEPSQNYQINFPDPGITGNMRYVLNAYLENAKYINPTITSTEITEPVLTGGLRIKRITSSNGSGQSLIKEYKYTKSYYNSTLFTGDFDNLALSTFYFTTSRWEHISNENVLVNGQWLWTVLRSPYVNTRTYSENSTVPLGSASNGALAYEEVEELQLDKNNIPLGKTTYTFNKALDEVPTYMPFYRSDNAFIRDQLISKDIYKYENDRFKIVEKETNTYTDFSSNPGIWFPGLDKIRFYVAIATFNDYFTDGFYHAPATFCLGCKELDNSTYSKFRIEPFYIAANKIALTSTKTTSYNDNEQPTIETVTDYEYNNKAHLLPTKISTSTSSGEKISEEVKYPLDLTNTSCNNTYPCETNFNQGLENLKNTLYSCQTGHRTAFHTNQDGNLYKDLHMNLLHPEAVISADNAYTTCQQQYDNDVQQLVTTKNSCLTSYAECVTSYYASLPESDKAIFDLAKKNIISPAIEAKEFRDSKLLSTTVTKYKNFSSYSTAIEKVQYAHGNNAFEDRLEYLSYLDGKVVSQRESNDVIKTYLWDNNRVYPIAEIINATSTDVAYTSFEADASSNWNVSSSQRDIVNSFTGTSSYALSNGNITTSGLDNSKKYKISFWAKNSSGAVTVNGAAPTASDTRSGWTMYQIILNTITGITISGTGTIDELRLHPVDAKMTTYCYEPGIGMTSQSDQNNLVIYYTYDGHGRLIAVKNHNGNIIKAYTYEYKKAN
jgi:hypothetical protein